MKNNECLVSIICVTYNHVNYIEEALRGFINQTTNFKYEILVGDDGSTDGSSDIILEYEKKYPDLIKAFIRKNNIGAKKNFSDLINNSRGRYLALCEGDDYWIDENKLSLQINELENNKNINMVFHPCYELIGEKYNRILSDYGKNKKIFTTSEIILGDGGFCPTSSLIVNRNIIENLPSWFEKAPGGDYIIQVLGSLSGGAIYVPRIMSIYRRSHQTSWSLNVNKSINNKLEWYKNTIDTMNNLDIFLNKNFTFEIKNMVAKYHYMMAIFFMRKFDFNNFRKYIHLIDKNYFFGWKFKTLIFFKNNDLALKIINLIDKILNK